MHIDLTNSNYEIINEDDYNLIFKRDKTILKDTIDAEEQNTNEINTQVNEMINNDSNDDNNMDVEKDLTSNKKSNNEDEIKNSLQDYLLDDEEENYNNDKNVRLNYKSINDKINAVNAILI